MTWDPSDPDVLHATGAGKKPGGWRGPIAAMIVIGILLLVSFLASCTRTITSLELVRCEQEKYTTTDTIAPDTLVVALDSVRLYNCDDPKYEGRIVR